MELAVVSRATRIHALVALGCARTFPAGGQAPLNQGQIDTFETARTLGWHIGIGFVGPTVQLGGPGGASDHYLQLTSNQSGGPPRWTMFNQNQWLGNWNSPAPTGSNPVNAIEMDI